MQSVIRLYDELSKSRSGKHAFRQLALIVRSDGSVERIEKPAIRRSIKPLYARGSAYEIYVEIPEGSYAVQLKMVKNLRNKVKGVIEVYDRDGRLLLRAVYRDEKVRRSRGDSSLEWVVRRVLDYLNIPYRRVNMGTGSG